MNTPAWWPTAEQKERADKAHADALAAKASRALPPPLVVWDNTVSCDLCGGDVRIVTDGTRVATETYTEHGGVYAATGDPERDGSQIGVECGAPCPCGYRDCTDMCGNPVTVDIATEHWTTMPVLIDRLAEKGVDIP